MKTLAILLPDETVARIEAAAVEHGITVEELVRASVEEKLARDRVFAVAAEYVLSKNDDLYERLA